MTQKTMLIALRAAPAALLLAGHLGHALAQDDAGTYPNEVRIGMYFVHYEATAADVTGPYTPPGINLRVADVNTPLLSYLRRIDGHWSIELAGGVPPQTKTYGKGPATVGSVPFDGQEVATAKWFSPSLLLDYTFLDPSNAVRPYLGAGMNYTRFYDRKSTAAGDAANGGPTSISLSSSWGPAATAGVAWRVAPRFSINGSYSLARVDSHYRSDTSGVIRTTTVHFNPRAWSVSVGYFF